jgi:flagellar biosynthetic protein FliR
MDPLNLALDAPWITGLLLALTRMGAFVAASPLLARTVALPGRLAVTVALALFFVEPTSGVLGISGLLAAALVNAVVGVALGYLTGVVFHAFAAAGSLIDLSSGLSVATLIDPNMGENAAVFGRLFNLVALTLFAALGGLHVVIRGMALSLAAVPLDGVLAPDPDLIPFTLGLVGQLVVAAAELALPVLAALFLAEVVLGLAARLAPQANVFILGLPAKLLITMTIVGATLLFFPEAMNTFERTLTDTFVDGLRGLSTA